MNVYCTIPNCKNLACQFFIHYNVSGAIDKHGTACYNHKWMISPYHHFKYIEKNEYIEKVLKFKILK